MSGKALPSPNPGGGSAVGTSRAMWAPFFRLSAPIYGHIGHLGSTARKCGDYSECLFERGKTRVLAIADDPVVAGLGREFEIMESHCGQIEYAPSGWVHIVAK